MAGGWDIVGNFLEGMNLRQQHETQRQTLEMQKKESDLKLKMLDLEAQKMAKQGQEVPQLVQLLQALRGGKGGQLPGGGTAWQQAEVPKSDYLKVDPSAFQEPIQGAAAGIDEDIAHLVARGMIKKQLGFDPEERTYRSGLAGEGGPYTGVYDATGREVGRLPEYRKPELKQVYDPQTHQYYWASITPGEFGPIASPAETEEKTHMASGVTYTQPYYKGTNSPAGPARVKEEAYSGRGKESQKSIYQANIKKIGIPAAQNLAKALFTVNEKGELAITTSARIQGTFPGLSQKLGGQIANDAIKLAYALLRPESGAVINVDERLMKVSAHLPKILTDVEYAKSQFLAIGDVIDEYLSEIDPEYEPRARELMEQALPKESTKGPSKMSTPPKLGKSSDNDPLGIR